MALIVGVNAYCDVNEATELLHDNFPSTDPVRKYWDNIASEDDKQAIIVGTTRKYDSDDMCYKWFKLEVNQPLQFPRIDINKNIIECPDDIKLGLLIQGIKTDISNVGNEYQNLKAQGIKSYKIKDASVEFFEHIDLEDIETVKQKNGMYKIVFDTYIKRYTEFI